MSSIADYSVSIAAIIVPILYSIFFEGSSILARKKNNILRELLTQFNVANGVWFYLLFALSVAIPIILLSWFDYAHLDSSLADFYLPSVAIIIIGVLLSIFRGLWVAFISLTGVFLLFHTFYIYHQYQQTLYSLYLTFLVFYIIYVVYSHKFPTKVHGFKKLQWITEIVGFSAFSFQLIYSIFVMGLTSLPTGSSVVQNLLLGDTYIIFIASWSALLAMSMALGLRWAWTSVRTAFFSVLLKIEPGAFKVSLKSAGGVSVKDGSIKSVEHSLVIQDQENEISIVPWEYVQRIGFEPSTKTIKRSNKHKI